MHTELVAQLRKFRLKAPVIPKRGSPPKSKFSSTGPSILQIFGAFTLLVWFFIAILAYTHHIAWYTGLHLVIQIVVLAFCFYCSIGFWANFFVFRWATACRRIIHEANLGALLCWCVMVGFASFYFTDFLSPYLSNLWQALKDNPTSPVPPYQFDVETSADFYQLWLRLSVGLFVYFLLVRVLLRWLEHRGQLEDITGFRLWLGESTGLLAKQYHGGSLAHKQQVALSLEDAAKNIVIMGGTGSGKTTRSVYPLLLQLADQDCGGLIFDIKNDFHHAVKTAFRSVAKEHHLKIIGKDHAHINLIEGLTPQVAASFLKSSLMLGGQTRLEAFWVDTAKAVTENALGILGFFPKYYNLSGLHEYLFNCDFSEGIDAQAAELLPTLSTDQAALLNTCHNYLQHIFGKFDDKVKSGVKASVAQILSPFMHPTLRRLFCEHSDVSMQEVLDGTTFLVQLPLSEWSLGGKVAYNLIKLRFFNLMQQRVSHPEWNQQRPVFFLCDEYQDVVSGNQDGVSDLNFWDKSRSSKTIGIISTQSLNSFYAAIGNENIADAVLQNFRQKIFYKTEDDKTLALLQKLTGYVDVEKRSVSRQSGKSYGESKSQAHNSRTETVSWSRDLVIDPQLVRNLEPYQAIAILMIHGHSCDDVINTLHVSL